MSHRTATELEQGLDEIRQSPKDEGRLELIVRRPIKGQREVLTEGELTFAEGLAGDCWKDHSPHPDMQIKAWTLLPAVEFLEAFRGNRPNAE